MLTPKYVYSLYRAKEITKNVYNNIINSIKLQKRMNTIFMNSRNSKISDPHRLFINLSDKINSKETQIFKTYQTESYKQTESYNHTNILNHTNVALLLQKTKILKTHRLFNKTLFSLCPSLCLLRLVLPVTFLNGRVFSFFEHSTPQILNVTSDHSCRIQQLRFLV